MPWLSLRNFYVKTNVDLDAVRNAGNTIDMDTEGEVRRLRLVGFSEDRPDDPAEVTWTYAVTDEDEFIELPFDEDNGDQVEFLQNLAGNGSASRFPSVFGALLKLGEEYTLDEAICDGVSSDMDSPDDMGFTYGMESGYSVEVQEDALEGCDPEAFVACYTNMILCELDEDSDFLKDEEGEWKLNPDTTLDCLDEVEGNGEMEDEFEAIAYTSLAPAYA